MNDFWATAISRVRKDEILVRGYPIEQLTRRCSFGDIVYLLLTGELPTGQEGRLVEAILVSCSEHSLASPSVDAVRFVASSGVPLQAAVAAGITAIGDFHGGAIEPCARLLAEAVKSGESGERLIFRLHANGQRMPGLGHRVHQRDPRATVLFDLAAELALFGPHAEFARSLEEATDKVLGRTLNLNVDGAIAALMCDLHIDPALGKAFFIVGRAPGYAAHAYEQIMRERPFKAASPEEIVYTGPDRRDLDSTS